jgi:hypothetical protein
MEIIEMDSDFNGRKLSATTGCVNVIVYSGSYFAAPQHGLQRVLRKVAGSMHVS